MKYTIQPPTGELREAKDIAGVLEHPSCRSCDSFTSPRNDYSQADHVTKVLSGGKTIAISLPFDTFYIPRFRGIDGTYYYLMRSRFTQEKDVGFSFPAYNESWDTTEGNNPLKTIKEMHLVQGRDIPHNPIPYKVNELKVVFLDFDQKHECLDGASWFKLEEMSEGEIQNLKAGPTSMKVIAWIIKNKIPGPNCTIL